MKNVEKERKPGRSVFFEEQDADERPPDESVVEEKKEAIAPGTDGNARLGLLLEALRAVKKGDFSVRLPTGKNGVMGEISEVFNDVVILNERLANEIIRTSKVVGEEGKLTERVALLEISGAWQVSADSMNSMINNLAQPTIEVARVITAVASGDLSEKMTLELEGRPIKGEFLRIGNTVNDMVDQLNAFAAEVTRVAREVGTEGKLGGQAEVKGVGGTWKDLTDNVNAMASNLTSQVRNIAEVTTAVAEGDLSRKITVEAMGEILELKNTINTMVDQLGAFASEVTRVAREVGTEGQLGGQAKVTGVAGTWKDLTDNVNAMASNLTSQVRNIAEVTTAVAQGDLSRKITVEALGEILELKNTINTMVDQLGAFASEVTRVAREVGNEGQLGGQAEVRGVAGTWKELTDNVNMLAANLTSQVRNIAEVTTAVAQGDLSRKITVEVKGEIQQLKNTINTMVDQLGAFASEVTRVAREVGTEGQLGGIEVEAQGEFASMVDGINATIESLRGIVRELTGAGVSIGEASQNMISTGQEMNAMATQLSTAVEQIAEGAKNQAQLIAEASKESGGVGETATDTLTRVENMIKMFESANKVTEAGGHAMEETIKNTDLMLEGSKESVDRIDMLSKSSEKIQEIVDVIRDIATQTNILAINAAIEAVRAGKQGKGFAVVAEEVKTLSADSKKQARDISTLVQAVLKETEATVTTIKTMASNVELGRKSIGETSKSFTDINQSVENTSKTAQEISASAGAQKTSIDAISKSLDKVSGIAADTSSSGTQLAASARDLLAKMQELNSIASTLADMSETLQQTVGRFELKEDMQKDTEATKRETAIAVRKRKTALPVATVKVAAKKISGNGGK